MTPLHQRNESALMAEWAQRYRAPLRRYFWRRVRHACAADIDDLVQDVFFRLACRSDIETIEEPDAYIFTTAASVLTDKYRRDAVRAVDARVPLDDEIEGGFSPERIALAQEAIEDLTRAFDELPEQTRAVFVLYHFEEFSHAQISERLHMPRSTIEKHMSRANRHLLRRMT